MPCTFAASLPNTPHPIYSFFLAVVSVPGCPRLSRFWGFLFSHLPHSFPLQDALKRLVLPLPHP